MASYTRMSGILPSIVLVLILLTDRGRGGGLQGNDAPSSIPTGISDRWGNRVQKSVWVTKGSSAVLACNMLELMRARIPALSLVEEGHRRPQRFNVTWFKNNETIFENRRMRVNPDGQLNITKVRRRGEFRCLISPNGGSNWALSGPPINLRIADLGKGSKHSSNNVTEGQALRLKCQISSQPTAAIHWEMQQKSLPHDDRIRHLPSGVLQITNVQIADAGLYKCSASNSQLNRTKQADILVSVLTESKIFSPPIFLSPNRIEPIVTTQGDDLFLECLATGIPMPTVSWYHKTYDSYGSLWNQIRSSERVRLLGEGNLHIKSATLRDAGLYACKAISHHPETSEEFLATQETIVQVVIPPSLSPSPKNITTLNAKTVRLNCSLEGGASSLAALQIQWYKDGRPLQTDTRIEVKAKTQLLIINSISNDTGMYQCFAMNQAGFATSWTYLVVNSSQDLAPPQNLRHVVLSPTAVLLEWDPVQSSDIAGYSIHYNELVKNPVELQIVAQNNTYLIDNLKPHTNYTYHIRVHSTYKGSSDRSEIAFFRTGEDVPQDDPTFWVENKPPNDVLVRWEPLPPEKTRGKITNYKVQWWPKKKVYYNIHEVGPDVFEHVLTGLMPGKTYKIRVLARTSVGYNEDVNWTWKSITIPEFDFSSDNLPMAPLLQYSILNTNKEAPFTIKLTWSRPPEDVTEVKGYIIRYRRVGHFWSDPVDLPPTETSYVISGLVSDTYKVKLRAYNNEHEGLIATQAIQLSPIKNQTLNDYSSTPIIYDLEVRQESQTIVQLSWKVKFDERDNVAYYTIEHQLVLSSNIEDPMFTRSISQTATINGLTPFSSYQFRVRAHISEKEFGPYSDPVQIGTTEIPPIPFNIIHNKKDPSTIEIEWDFPRLRRDRPSQFEIFYSRNTTIPVDNWHKESVPGDTLRYELGGLVSNKKCWIQIGGCFELSCGPYSETIEVCIKAVLLDPEVPTDSPPSHIYLIIGIATFLMVLSAIAVVAFYLLKVRNLNRPPNIFNCNGNNHGVNSHHDGHGHEHNSAEHNGAVSDINRSDADYIPMLNLIPTDLPTTTLDTKGGYPNTRVNGFTNPKCNGLIRGLDLHYGHGLNSAKGEESEESERLFVPSDSHNVKAPLQHIDSFEEVGGDAKPKKLIELMEKASTGTCSQPPPTICPYPNASQHEVSKKAANCTNNSSSTYLTHICDEQDPSRETLVSPSSQEERLCSSPAEDGGCERRSLRGSKNGLTELPKFPSSAGCKQLSADCKQHAYKVQSQTSPPSQSNLGASAVQ